jgi:hypothetical protein
MNGEIAPSGRHLLPAGLERRERHGRASGPPSRRTAARRHDQKTPSSERFFATVQPPEGNELRYEEAGEAEVAKALLEVLNGGNFSPPFRLRPVQNRTPYFLSLFIAPG